MTQYNRCPVVIRGVYYPSQTAAAKAVGVNSPTKVRNMSGRDMKNKKGYPVTIRGVTYISGAAAARAIGVSTAAVYVAIDRGRPDSVGTGRNTLNSTRVSHAGVEYESIAMLADAFDIKRSILRKRIYDARKKGVDYNLNGKPVKIMLD